MLDNKFCLPSERGAALAVEDIDLVAVHAGAELGSMAGRMVAVDHGRHLFTGELEEHVGLRAGRLNEKRRAGDRVLGAGRQEMFGAKPDPDLLAARHGTEFRAGMDRNQVYVFDRESGAAL